MAKQETALTVRRENLPAPVTTFEEIKTLGVIFSKSGMFGAKTDEEGLVIAMTCVMEKKTPMEFQQTYHIIDRKLVMRADAMLAALLEVGGDYVILKRDSECASVQMKCGTRDGVFTLTHDQVKLEPFYWNREHTEPKDNYATPHKRMQMLWARVTSDGCRAVNPGGVKGIYTPEEVGDFTEDDRVTRARVVTPEAVAETLKPDATTPSAETTATASAKPAGKAKAAPKATKPAEVVTPEVLKPADPTPVDYAVMPCGKFKGMKFSNLDEKVLGHVISARVITEDELAKAKATLDVPTASANDRALASSTLGMSAISEQHKAEARKALEAKQVPT